MIYSTASIFGTLGLALSTLCSAAAPYVEGFEPPAMIAAPNGAPLAGQGGWSVPPNANVGFKVYPYAGNSLGLFEQFGDGLQFVAGKSSLNTSVGARFPVSLTGASQYTVSADVTVLPTNITPSSTEFAEIGLVPFAAQSAEGNPVRVVLAWKSTTDRSAYQVIVRWFDAESVLRSEVLTEDSVADLRAAKRPHIRIKKDLIDGGIMICWTDRNGRRHCGGHYIVAPGPSQGTNGFEMAAYKGAAIAADNIVIETPVVCDGDMNGDAWVDDADFTVFVQAYDLLLCENELMSDGCAADLNTDALVDDTDFTLFVVAYNNLVCP